MATEKVLISLEIPADIKNRLDSELPKHRISRALFINQIILEKLKELEKGRKISLRISK